MIIGTLLVLVTWIVLNTVWIFAGLPFSGPRSGSRVHDLLPRLRRSMWWGAGLFTLVVLAVSITLPLRSAQALFAVVLALLPFVILGIISVRRLGRPRPARRPSLLLPLIASGWIALAYLAWAVLGPVTNYDTGLYHLGAISYAGDYAAIPGLANLYFPFGYNNAQFPLAAFLGNGPWQGEGFRLLNGLLLFAMVTDLVLRHRSRSLGTFVLAVGVVVALIPMVALDDYWMSSPTSDPAVMFLTLLSAAYLADGLTRRRGASADLAVASVLAILTVTLRPLMAVFALAVLAAVLLAQRAPGRRMPASAWLSVLGFGAFLGAVQSIRDYFLSGWLQFPLSFYAFDVPWLAEDPVGNRTATLGAARNPADLWNAAESWDWIGPWLMRLPSQWEPFLLGLLIAAALLVIWPVRARMPWRSLTFLLAPFVVVAVVWFLFSPPSFRFAWGPIFALGVIPLAMALRLWTKPDAKPALTLVAAWGFRGAALAVIVATSFTALWRSDPATRTNLTAWRIGSLSIDIPITPVTAPAVREETLASGLLVVMPVETDQCWAVYPLCTPQISQNVHLRGAAIDQGFSAEPTSLDAEEGSP